MLYQVCQRQECNAVLLQYSAATTTILALICRLDKFLCQTENHVIHTKAQKDKVRKSGLSLQNKNPLDASITGESKMLINIGIIDFSEVIPQGIKIPVKVALFVESNVSHGTSVSFSYS